MKFSPLDAEHRALGAKMVPFGGWEMPLAYPTGTLAEHAACRQGCALFDVSHLGTVRVAGQDAFARLQASFTNDLSKVSVGRAQYTHLCNDKGGVLDDIIVWWVDDELFDVMPNASNTDRVITAVGGVDVTSERAVIAVQGPTARQIAATVIGEAAQVRRFGVVSVAHRLGDLVVAGTGYTGEDGIEIAVPRDQAGAMWSELCAAGGVPAGLGARDTLRLEAALPLHGHELTPDISTLEAGLGWVVAWNKGDFPGRDALEAQRQDGLTRRMRGLSLDGRRPAREGSTVHLGDGSQVGVVTSGNFSPTLGHCIALCLIDATVTDDDELFVDIRGTKVPVRQVPTPFVKKAG